MSSLATPQPRRRRPEGAPAIDGYRPMLKVIHWTTVLLIAAMFASVWAANAAPTREQHAMLLQLHRSLGLTIFGLTVFRLGWRWRMGVPALPADLPRLQALAARAVHIALYALLLVQPLLGLVHSNARGVRADFFFLGNLPALVGRDPWLAKRALAAHEIAATLLLALIGLHAAAALYHHFVRRDGVLRTILPARRPV
jgi:superoxide oxidase